MRIVSDFDGVVGNSLPTALQVVRDLVGLFAADEEVNGFQDYRRLIGKNSSIPGVTSAQAEVLREMHRILMLHRAGRIGLFQDVLDVYARLRQKPDISSSSLTATIRAVLGDRTSYFSEIYGFDYAKKEEVLAELWRKGEFIYVTDSTIDIKRCHTIGIPMIAVSWGYDSVELLQSAEPDFFASDCSELMQIFENLNLIK